MLVDDLRPVRFLRFLAPQILLFSAVGAVAVAGHSVFHHPDFWGLREDIPTGILNALGWYKEGVPFGAIAALGSALAIFLGFRNSSAYDRWWEARKIWGALVNESRSFARQVLAWTEAPTDTPDDLDAVTRVQRELIHRQLAFVHGLRIHLRHEDNLVDSIKHFLHDDDEIEQYREVPNVPTALLIQQGLRIAEARDEGQLEHFRTLEMDRLLTRLSDVQGKCERINNTPVPRQYDTIPRVFVYVHGFFLPFGIVASMGWAALPITVAITILFSSLEQSGRALEDPFEGLAMDTPMSALSITIERDLRAALGEEVPDALEPDDDGVLM